MSIQAVTDKSPAGQFTDTVGELLPLRSRHLARPVQRSCDPSHTALTSPKGMRDGSRSRLLIVRPAQRGSPGRREGGGGCAHVHTTAQAADRPT